MENISPQQLARLSKELMFHKNFTIKDSNSTQFLSSIGGEAQHRAANYDKYTGQIQKYFSAVKKIKDFDDVRGKIIQLKDSQEELDNLNKLKDFVDSFKSQTGLEINSLRDDFFEKPTIDQLGFSYTSGTTYVDPTFYTAGLPELKYLEVYGGFLTGGMPFTTDVIKSMMYQISGDYADFNRETGVTDGSALNQTQMYGNWGTFRKGIKFRLPTHWSNVFREAHGIPYLASNYETYFMDKIIDRAIAWGEPRAGIFGILNCRRSTIDLSAITVIPGFGDGLYEATALQNLFNSILLKIRTVGTEIEKRIEMISIPRNLYNHLKTVRARLIAKSTSTDWVGSTEARGDFIQWLEQQEGVGSVVAAPVTQPRIIMLVRTNKQTYNPIQMYISPTQTIVSSTFDAAPANVIRESAIAISDMVVRDDVSIIDIRLPDIANANVIRREYVPSGFANNTAIPVPTSTSVTGSTGSTGSIGSTGSTGSGSITPTEAVDNKSRTQNK